MNCNNCLLCISKYNDHQGSYFECALTEIEMKPGYNKFPFILPPHRGCDVPDKELQWFLEDIQEELQKRGVSNDQSGDGEVCE